MVVTFARSNCFKSTSKFCLSFLDVCFLRARLSLFIINTDGHEPLVNWSLWLIHRCNSCLAVWDPIPSHSGSHPDSIPASLLHLWALPFSGCPLEGHSAQPSQHLLQRYMNPAESLNQWSMPISNYKSLLL